ncbi:MAG: DUF6261 family protein [Chitinispirillaceae bacterium]
MALKSLPLYKMVASEIVTVARRMMAVVRNALLTDPHQEEVVDVLEKDTDAAEEAIGETADSSLTKEVKEADAGRDLACTEFAGYLRGQEFHWDEEIVAAAEYLYNILRNHGFGGREQGYAAQSGIMNAMIKDLDTEAARAAIEKVNGQPLMEKVISSQKAFTDAVMKRIKEAGDVETPAISAVIKPVKEGISDLYNHLSSRERLHPEQYADVIRQVNQMISEVSAPVRARISRNAATPTTNIPGTTTSVEQSTEE